VFPQEFREEGKTPLTHRPLELMPGQSVNLDQYKSGIR